MGKGFRVKKKEKAIGLDIIESVLGLLTCSDDELRFLDEVSDEAFYQQYGVRYAKSSGEEISIYQIWKSSS